MDAELYEEILRSTLLPFISQKFPRGRRFMQDNDPKHTSGCAQAFFTENGLTGGKHLLNHLISTLSRTCGTNLKSTFIEKLSHAQKKN